MRYPQGALVGGAVLALVACNQLAGINEGTLRDCATRADCEIEVRECRVAVDCRDGRCVFDDLPEGAPLELQTPGDCVELVCDGDGGTKLLDVPEDIADDGDPCTLDECIDGKSTHTKQARLSCYNGPPWTRGVGRCKDGTQTCDAEGKPVTRCEGQVFPSEEECDLREYDEDCDGRVNEEGALCVCLPGIIVDCYTGPAGSEALGICHAGKQSCATDGLGYGPCIGEQTPLLEHCDAERTDDDCDGKVNEEGDACLCGDGFVSVDQEGCDDGNLDPTDACTPSCQLAECGDGFVQPVVGEECDDGNTSDGDGCSSRCLL